MTLTADSLGRELVAGLHLTQTPEGPLRAPTGHGGTGIVFGGQLLGQAIVAAAAKMPTKTVRSIQMVFAKAAKSSTPVNIDVDPMHEGRNIGSSTVSFWQDDRVCARALVLHDVGESDLIRHQIAMPDVEAPDLAKAVPRAIAAPETILVGGVDLNDPTLTGPPSLQLWIRFPVPGADEPAMSRALLSHATDGWLIATAMRPHEGLGQAMAHTEVSTGVLTHDLVFHAEFDAGRWLLIDLESLLTGNGRAYGRGHVFTEDGSLVASFVQEAMIRRLSETTPTRGRARTF